LGQIFKRPYPKFHERPYRRELQVLFLIRGIEFAFSVLYNTDIIIIIIIIIIINLKISTGVIYAQVKKQFKKIFVLI